MFEGEVEDYDEALTLAVTKLGEELRVEYNVSSFELCKMNGEPVTGKMRQSSDGDSFYITMKKGERRENDTRRISNKNDNDNNDNNTYKRKLFSGGDIGEVSVCFLLCLRCFTLYWKNGVTCGVCLSYKKSDKGFNLGDYLDIVMEQEKDIKELCKLDQCNVSKVNGVFEQIHDLGKDEKTEKRFKFRLQNGQNAEYVNFVVEEEDSGHYVIALKNLKLLKNVSILNRTKDALKDRAVFTEDGKKVYLCMLFWFIQIYFRHDQNGVKRGCKDVVKALLEKIEEEERKRSQMQGVKLMRKLITNLIFV